MGLAGAKSDWALSQESLRNLLRWLDEGVDSDGARYLQLRQRLAMYFERKNCLAPDDLADETLNRVARRLQETGAITDVVPAQYCYIMAKYVFLEYLRQARSQGEFQQTRETSPPAPAADAQLKEDSLAALEQCLAALTATERELILDYYRGEQRAKIERRRALAAQLGISLNALAIRACRLRDRLEQCVKTRLGDARQISRDRFLLILLIGGKGWRALTQSPTSFSAITSSAPRLR